MCSGALVKEVAVCITTASNLAVTATICIIKVRADFFPEWYFCNGIMNRVYMVIGKRTLNLKNFILRYIELTKLVFSCIDFSLVKERTQINSSLEFFRAASFFIKTLSKYFLKQKSTERLG